jgi:hypothetical protein
MRRKDKWDVKEPATIRVSKIVTVQSTGVSRGHEEIISLSRGAALLNESIIDFREKLSEVA